MSTIAQYQIHITRERDSFDCGVFKQSGGWGRSAPSPTSREQYGEGVHQHGGQATFTNVTATKTFFSNDSLPAQMLDDVGHTFYVLNRQKLDIDGHAVGAPFVRRGMLVDFKLSDTDVNGEGVDEYTAEWAIEG
jgi:hypothetical protein